MPGLFFEEFTVGQTFDHPIRRTVTETDNVLITTLTHNPAALHLDAEYMKNTEFGKPLVNSCLTLSSHGGNFSCNDTTHGTTVANLGWDEVRFPKPLSSTATRSASKPRCSTRSRKQAQDPITVSSYFATSCVQPGRTNSSVSASATALMMRKRLT